MTIVEVGVKLILMLYFDDYIGLGLAWRSLNSVLLYLLLASGPSGAPLVWAFPPSGSGALGTSWGPSPSFSSAVWGLMLACLRCVRT